MRTNKVNTLWRRTSQLTHTIFLCSAGNGYEAMGLQAMRCPRAGDLVYKKGVNSGPTKMQAVRGRIEKGAKKDKYLKGRWDGTGPRAYRYVDTGGFVCCAR